MNTIKVSWIKLHRALHDGSDSVIIDGIKYPVITGHNNCRCIRYTDTDLGKIMVMEQNKNKSSEYAQRARNGETLSWVIPNNGSKWHLIELAVGKEVSHA